MGRPCLGDQSFTPVIAGIGAYPNVELAAQAGLHVANGVVTDLECRTSDTNIFAIGDCAARPIVQCEGRLCRLESVHNAIEGAKIVASVLTGQRAHATEAPWFWSDQYDLKLQIAGLFQDHDRAIVRGSIEARSFAVFYYKNERLIAVDAINRPGEFLGAKLLIQTRRSVAPELIKDEAIAFKELVARAS